MIDLLCASVADVRGPVKAGAAFPLKVRAGLVAGGAGGALHAAEDDLAADVGLPAVITVDAEVVGIVEGALVVPVGEAVGPDFLGDGGRILAQEPCDILERSSLIQFIFNVDTVIKGKMFLVAWDKSAHSSSFYCCQKER